MPKKVNAKNHKNPYILKSKSQQFLRVASQQSLHTKSTDKLNHFHIIQSQTPIKIKKSLHDLPKNPSKHTPLSTHKSKRLTSKRLEKSPPISKLQLGIKTKNKTILKSKNSAIIEVQLQKKNQYKNLPSFREYCIVDSDFVPLATSDQKRFFTGLMANTVSTCDPENWASRVKKHHYKGIDSDQDIDIFVPNKHKNQNFPIENKNEYNYENKQVFLQQNSQMKTQVQKIINFIEPIIINSAVNQFCQTDVKSTRNQEIQIQLNFKQYEQIGTQYSNRQQFQQIKKKQEPQKQNLLKFNLKAQKSNDPRLCQHQRRQQSIQQILLKLEFLHLPQKNSFSHLTSIQRQHYAQLLQSLLSKMMVTPRTPRYDNQVMPNQRKVNIRSTTIDQLKSDSPNYSQSDSQKSPSKRLQGYIQDFQVQETLQQKQMKSLQMLNYQIQIRQLKQLGMLQTSNHSVYTLVGIANLLTNLLTFLQLNYAPELVHILNRVYGYSYRDRFLKITKNINQSFNYKKLLPESMYNDFLQEVVSEPELQSNDLHSAIIQQAKWVYCKALFDCLNEEIDSYRAFFSSDGQPFPWSLKIIKSITYFTIDEQSIQIVFSQIKQRIIGYSSSLCGLLIQHPDKYNLENPLLRKRNDIQGKIMQKQISKVDQTPQIQSQSTKILLQMSKWSINQLINQAIFELVSILVNNNKNSESNENKIIKCKQKTYNKEKNQQECQQEYQYKFKCGQQQELAN